VIKGNTPFIFRYSPENSPGRPLDKPSVYVYYDRTHRSRGAKGSGLVATGNGDGEGAAGYLITVPASRASRMKRTRCGARCVEGGGRDLRFGSQSSSGLVVFFRNSYPRQGRFRRLR